MALDCTTSAKSPGVQAESSALAGLNVLLVIEVLKSVRCMERGQRVKARCHCQMLDAYQHISIFIYLLICVFQHDGRIIQILSTLYICNMIYERGFWRSV